MKVFNCNLLHGAVTIDDCSRCQHHPLYEPRTPEASMSDCSSATREMSVADMAALIRTGPPGPWPCRQEWRNGRHHDIPQHSWHCWENTQEAMRVLADEFIASMPEYPGHYSGRGVVIAGGGTRYFPSVYVCVAKLRHLGCKLPIELWHLGSAEMDPYMTRIMSAFGVRTIDARKVERYAPARILCGWELKPYAILHSSFREVIFLDADNHALSDPEALFSEPAYLERGAVFWPDYDYWTLDENLFRIFGIPYRREPAFESGQLLINKEAAWRGILLAQWYADHSDFTFKHVYGDKEAFHLGWRKVGLDYAMPPRGPGWQCDCTIVQNGMDGRPLFLHRTGDKWRLGGGNKRCHLPDEALHHRFLDDLRAAWSGRLWYNEAPSPVEQDAIDSLCHRKFEYRRLPTGSFAGDSRTIELLPGGRVGAGADECERRWEVNALESTRGTPLLLSLCGAEAPTCHLELGTGGVWLGRWESHERCAVELVPIASDPGDSLDLDLSRLSRDVAALLRRHGYRIDNAGALAVIREMCKKPASAVKAPGVPQDERPRQNGSNPGSGP